MIPSGCPQFGRVTHGAIVLSAVVGVATTTARGQCNGYTVEIVPAPLCPIFGPMSMGVDTITANAMVTGTIVSCDFHWQPYLWTGQEVEIIVTPAPYLEARGNDANSNGEVVGYMSGPLHRAFVYQRDQVINLGTLPGGHDSEALAISETGQVVGWSDDGIHPRAVKWDDHAIATLDLPIGPNSTANHVNDRNQIVGWMGVAPGPFFSSDAFLWHDGKTITLERPNDAIASSAWRVNNRTVILQDYWVPAAEGAGYARRACLWSEGQCTDVPLLLDCTDSSAGDINDYNMVLAGCWGQRVSHQFLWWEGAMIDYLQSVPQELGLTVFGGVSVNNAGEILCSAEDENRDSIILILKPNPPDAGDFNCDKLVNVDDLIGVIKSWNIAGGGPADFDNDNTVGVGDLLMVLDNWTL
jgi:uncharacterized membrane protein